MSLHPPHRRPPWPSRLLAPVLLLLGWIAPLHAADVYLSGPLAPGTAVLMRVLNPPTGATFSGALNGAPFPMARNGMALLALDMHAKGGEATLEVTITPADGPPETLTRILPVPPRKYEEEHLGLPGHQVNPSAKDAARAKRENEAIHAILERRGGEAGYLEGFQIPITTGRLSGIFGSQRILNGQPRSPHNGVDIAAPRGTPIAAPAAGVVALVGKEYFYTGNTVLLDHGDGVVTLYAHLARAMVQEGDWVSAGTVIGTVGKSGRATGPHLHWGTLVRGARVDPLRLPGLEDYTARLLQGSSKEIARALGRSAPATPPQGENAAAGASSGSDAAAPPVATTDLPVPTAAPAALQESGKAEKKASTKRSKSKAKTKKAAKSKSGAKSPKGSKSKGSATKSGKGAKTPARDRTGPGDTTNKETPTPAPKKSGNR